MHQLFDHRIVLPASVRLNARSSLQHVMEGSVPEQAIRPVCTACQSKPTGEACLRRANPTSIINLTATGSYPGADEAGFMTKIDLGLSVMEGVNHTADAAVALQPLGAAGWSGAPDELGHDKLHAE